MQHDGWLAITELHFTDQNPNRGDVDAIMNSIRTYGYNDTLHVWWNKPNEQWRIKGGEHRIKALLRLHGEGFTPRPDYDKRLKVDGSGEWLVAVQDVNHLPDEMTANGFMLALNNLTRKGEDDPEQLSDLLMELNDELIQGSGFNLEDVEGLINFDMDSDGENSNSEKSDGSLLELVNVTIEDPTHQVNVGDVYFFDNGHILVCESVVKASSVWSEYLEEDMLFCPFPGVFIPMIETDQRILMVQPDSYISGHILDRYVEQGGTVDKG